MFVRGLRLCCHYCLSGRFCHEPFSFLQHLNPRLVKCSPSHVLFVWALFPGHLDTPLSNSCVRVYGFQSGWLISGDTTRAGWLISGDTTRASWLISGDTTRVFIAFRSPPLVYHLFVASVTCFSRLYKAFLFVARTQNFQAEIVVVLPFLFFSFFFSHSFFVVVVVVVGLSKSE